MADPQITFPKTLPLLVVTDGVLIPRTTARIPVSTVRDVNLVRSRLSSGVRLSSAVVCVVTKDSADKGQDELHKIGTAAMVVQVMSSRWPRPFYTLLVTGLCRVRLDQLTQAHPYPVASVTPLESITATKENGEVDEKVASAMAEFTEAVKELALLDYVSSKVGKLKKLIGRIPGAHLVDVASSLVPATVKEHLEVIDAVDLHSRIQVVLPLIQRYIKRLKEVKEEGSKPSAESPQMEVVRVLRQGGGPTQDLNESELSELEARLRAAQLPPYANKVVTKELSRLSKMVPHMPEYAVVRNYLDLVADLPWAVTAPDTCNIARARNHLNADHYGMEKVKRRVLEYLAVRQLRGDLKGPILCFVGPPGVGKTSIVRSIATTLGRPYHRISLGGVTDQHDIRGHRRTYIGAMPGRIIEALRTTKAKNPVLLLDEIDKVGTSRVHGDPGAALLEVLDPAQNSSFTDTYLALPFDLSQVLFVATANSLSSIHTPLLDRMEVIPVPGYTQEEKVMIGQLHLLPKQLQEHGLTPEIFQIPTTVISTIIESYTREAGVRTLERKLGAMCRAVAVRAAEALTPPDDKDKPSEEEADTVGSRDKSGEEEIKEDPELNLVEDQPGSEGKGQTNKPAMFNLNLLQEHLKLPIEADQRMVEEVLGPAIFVSGLAGRVSVPGVALGLSWTPVGGEVMVVEATRTHGDAGLTLTGQLGSILQESAKIALTWVRQHAPMLGLEQDFMRDKEVHLHFPAGATSKDGPSAGVTILTVLVSLLTDRCVRSDVAMTGEITLNGVVLPVGGVKEKLLAGHRAGLATVIIPAANKKDLADIPASILSEMEVVLVNSVEEVFQAAFDSDFLSSCADSTNNQPIQSKL